MQHNRKSRRVIVTLEFESKLTILEIKRNLRALLEIYDENKLLQLIQIQANVIKETVRR